jgi:signal transduction histidine kinase
MMKTFIDPIAVRAKNKKRKRFCFTPATLFGINSLFYPGMRLALFILVGSFGLVRAHAQADSLAMAKLNGLAYKYFLYKPDSSIILATQAIALAEKSGSTFHAAYGYYILSKANWAKANYLLSVHYGFKSLRMYENTNYIYHWGECNIGIARTFIDLRKFGPARSYIEQTVSLSKKYNDPRLLAEAFREKSFLLLEQKQYDSALYYADEGLKLYQKEKDSVNESILFGRKTRIFFELKDYSKAMAFSRNSLLFDSLSGNRRALGISYFMLGQIYYALNKKDSALSVLKKSIPVSRSIRNLPNLIRANQLIAKVYQERKQFSEATMHLALVSQYKDSLYNLEENGQIQEILSSYLLDAKEKTIQSLETENALEKQRHRNSQMAVIFISVVAILLATLSIVFWRMRQWKAREAQTLDEVNQLKSKLFSVISHDLRGPINNLQSLLSMVMKDYLTPEEFKNISVKLKSSLNVSQSTLENLLNWSLGQMEGIRTQKADFDVTSTIGEVIQLSEESALRKNIKLTATMNDTMLVNADVNQVSLILRNIINNAIKFSQHGSCVSVKTFKQGDFCKIDVCDNGLGMTSEEIKMVLNSNEYFTKSGTDKEKGTGLGFLLCKDFIKRNGGEVSIQSEVGKSTCVSFTLPLA